MATDMTIASTIKAQLGGSKFETMTGAKDFYGTHCGLTFRLGANPKGVTHVIITLNGHDLYDMEFRRYRAAQAGKTLAKCEGIYAEDLCRAFTQHTGLYTSL